jgi:hypothetical protein
MTAVEWLIQKREEQGTLYFSDFCEAKEMEKQQQNKNLYSEEELKLAIKIFYMNDMLLTDKSLTKVISYIKQNK